MSHGEVKYVDRSTQTVAVLTMSTLFQLIFQLNLSQFCSMTHKVGLNFEYNIIEWAGGNMGKFECS